jgi:hypothetical protein
VTGDFSPAAFGRILAAGKTIAAFSLAGKAGTIDEDALTIDVIVPYGTDLTSLTPTVAHTGVRYDPAGPRDFTGAVIYTVTALDGSTRTYTVTVTVQGQISITISGTGDENRRHDLVALPQSDTLGAEKEIARKR